jgi:tryptophanyl-tRNA synthetase
MLISLCTGEAPDAIAERIGEGGGGMLKNELTVAMNDKLRPLREERARLEKDPEYIRQVLLTGAQKAREIGIKTLEEVRSVMNMEI